MPQENGVIPQRKLRVLLVLPYHHPNFIKFLPEFEPYAFLILGTAIQDIADVEVIDMRFERKSALAKRVKRFIPDVIGIRAHTAADTDTVLEIAETCKKISPETLIVIGGQCCTLQPHDFLSPVIDILCMGHGDKTFRELIEVKIAGKSFENVAGLCLIKDGEVTFTPPREISPSLFSWPPLRRDLLSKYESKYDAQLTITSMGCPWRCKFCALWVVAEGNYLLREPEDVVRDIESCSSHWIHFGDDNTFHNYQHAMAIYELIKQKGIKKKLTAYARTDTVTKYPELFEKWASIGLKEIVVGFEAFKEDELKYINKRNSAENNKKAEEILTRLGITALAHFIVFPHYTRQDFKDLWNYIDELNFADPIFPPLTPLPGTETFSEAKQRDELAIFDLGWYNLEYMVLKTKLPKWLWYCEYLKLWLKTVLPWTFYKRHKNVGWTFQAYLERLKKVSRATPKYIFYVAKQLYLEQRLAKQKGNPSKLRKTFEKDYMSPFLQRVLKKVSPSNPLL